LDFFLKLMFLVVLSKILVSLIDVTFNLDAYKVSFLNYL